MTCLWVINEITTLAVEELGEDSPGSKMLPNKLPLLGPLVH